MTLEELKDQNVSAVERAKAVVSALGLKGNERSVVVGLSKGDKFKLVAMNKVDLPTNANQPQSNFTPITFSTDTGATIGAKHFAGVEIDDDAPAIYYGLNALSNNMIMADRKRLRTPNGVILGTPGSGKSFSAKREILSCFLMTKDDIVVCDPEGEYFQNKHRKYDGYIRQ